MFIVRNIAGDFRASTVIGPEFLFPPAMIVGDHGIGRGEDILGGTIILLQQDCACLGIVSFEFFDIANGGTAECIDGLVGVANHAELAGIRSGADKRGDENVLGMVGVLVLINKNVTKTFSIVGGDFGVGGKHPHGFPDEIVEVESVSGPQPPLVFGVHLGNGAVERVTGGGRLVASGVGVGKLGFQRGDGGGQQSGREFLGVDLQVFGDHAEEPFGIVGIIDGEVGVEPGQQVRLLPQNPHAGGVEGGNPHAGGGGANQVDHPVAHFGGGLIGEGDGKDLPRGDAPHAQQVGDAPGEHGGFPGASTRNDEQRGTGMFHGGALLRIQVGYEIVGASLRARPRLVCRQIVPRGRHRVVENAGGRLRVGRNGVVCWGFLRWGR